MSIILTLPRLVFGSGALSRASAELALLGVRRSLLLSDRGLEKAGAVARAEAALPGGTALHLDVPENPTLAGAEAAHAEYDEQGCDGIVALGGGSVIDTAKFVAALAATPRASASSLLAKPDLIGGGVAPLVAIPTTIGTGSESSPVSALHAHPGDPAIGTRSPMLVPRVAICDPDLARTLPPRLIAATGIDALSHCLEGFFAEPAHPIIDALALDGITKVFANLRAAITSDGEAARANIMAAAFAGGVAIHKGLGPAHAIAVTCGDQDLHHGMLVAAALPWTTSLVARHLPAKAGRIAQALGLEAGTDLGEALAGLIQAVGLTKSYRELGYRMTSLEKLMIDIGDSPFNRTSPYVPSQGEYRSILEALLA